MSRAQELRNLAIEVDRIARRFTDPTNERTQLEPKEFETLKKAKHVFYANAVLVEELDVRMEASYV